MCNEQGFRNVSNGIWKLNPLSRGIHFVLSYYVEIKWTISLHLAHSEIYSDIHVAKFTKLLRQRIKIQYSFIYHMFSKSYKAPQWHATVFDFQIEYGL